MAKIMASQFKPTNAYLTVEADNLERHAKESLETWIVLGQIAKYEEAMELARKMRHAMTIKGLDGRREYLGWK